jgi:antitoxin component of MazEF toxin-antitoxin module
MSVIEQQMKDEIVFISKISKMGENRIIWIPAVLHEMIKDYEDKKVKVRIKIAPDN